MPKIGRGFGTACLSTRSDRPARLWHRNWTLGVLVHVSVEFPRCRHFHNDDALRTRAQAAGHIKLHDLLLCLSVSAGPLWSCPCVLHQSYTLKLFFVRPHQLPWTLGFLSACCTRSRLVLPCGQSVARAQCPASHVLINQLFFQHACTLPSSRSWTPALHISFVACRYRCFLFIAANPVALLLPCP